MEHTKQQKPFLSWKYGSIRIRFDSAAGLRSRSVDSQKTRGEVVAATNAFDGDVSTFWHTEWWARDRTHPHRIGIDLGAWHDLDGFRYLPRQDGGVNRRVKGYAFYVSLDGVTSGALIFDGNLVTVPSVLVGVTY